MHGALTRARALAVVALVFGALGALVIAPASIGAEEPPVPPPPDYEYDVLPGIQPGHTFDAVASTLADRNLELNCGWHGACYDYRPAGHSRGLRHTDTDGPGIDIKGVAGTPVYAAFRAVRLDARAGALTARVDKVVGRMDSGNGCMKVIVSVYDGTNEVGRLRYTHTYGSIDEDTPIVLPKSTRGLSAYALTKVGELVALGADPHCPSILPHLHFGRGDRFSGSTLHHNRAAFTATTVNARAVEAAGEVDMASGTLTGLGFPKGHHPDPGGRRTDPRLTASQRGAALYASPKFCSDTWVLKIQAASRSAPQASDVEPCAPSGLRVTPGASQLVASWDNPGDSSISGYEIRYKESAAEWPADSRGGGWAAIGKATSRTITGLTNETAYDVQVRAVVRHGQMPAKFLRGPAASVSGKPTPDKQCTVSVITQDGDGNPLTVAGVGVTGGGAGPCGARTLTVELTNGNYAFTRWTVGPATGLTRVCAPSSATCMLTFGTGAGSARTVAVTAAFERKQCTVTGRVRTLDRSGDLDSSLTGGTVSANGEDDESARVPCGDDVTLTAKAASGYAFVRWSGCTSVAANGTACTVTTSGLTLGSFATATFKQDPNCTLTVTAGTGGTARGNWSGPCGTRRTITARPSSSDFGGWSGDVSGSDKSMTFTVNRNMIAHAAFSCTLTVTAGTGGTAKGTWSGPCGTKRAIMATPTNSAFAGWSGDVSGSARAKTFTVNEHTSARASFSCTLTVTAGTGGTAKGSWSGPCGTTRTIMATPTSSAFAGWSGDVSGSASSLTFAVNEHISARASFSCTLTVAAGTGGTAGGGGTVPCSASTWRTATANEKAGYNFSRWSGDCSGSGTCRVRMIRNRSVTAHFTAKSTPQCTVVAVASKGGTVSGGSTVDCGTAVTLRASANAGFCFSYWQQHLPPEDLARRATSSSCPATGSISVKTSSGNLIYQAVFRAKRSYTLSATVVPSGAGSVSGTGSYTEGTPATLTAKAVAPYFLRAWVGCDSSSGTTCKVTMNGNRTVTASFDNLCESVPGLCARPESE